MFTNKQIRDMSLVERLSNFSEKKSNGCVEYSGTIESTGYGSLRFKGKRYKAHRAAYIAHKGQIPKGLQVNHTCDNKKCINPDHLWVGTQKENMDDMKNKGRDNRIGRKGSKSHMTKLTEDDVQLIRGKFINGASRAELSKEYKLSKTALRNILANESWQHVGLGCESAKMCRKNYAKKLTLEEVREIKKLLEADFITRDALAEMFNVTVGNIDLIKANKIWKNI